MNVSCNKLLQSFLKYNFWNVKVKWCSTHGILRNKFVNKTEKESEQFPGFLEKNKILDSILASELCPYINRSKLSLLRSYFIVKQSRPIYNSFVVDSSVANDIVSKILPELIQGRNLIIEANPGLGLITLNLLKSKVSELHIYENSKVIEIALQQLINKYSNKVNLESYNILFPRSTQLVKVLNDAININVHNKIIGVVQQHSFFGSLIQECIHCSLWNCLQFTHFFLVITKSIWKNVMQNNESRNKYFTYCFFNLIFETQLLAEYPSSAFLPHSPSNDGKMFFVKISKRPTFPGELTEQDIKSLLNLCKILGRTKFNYIIPTLENWIPECGPYLISKGLSVTNQINDLSFNEFLKLYLLLKKFKGFKNFEILD